MAQDGVEGRYSVALAKMILGDTELPKRPPQDHIDGYWDHAHKKGLTLNQKGMTRMLAYALTKSADDRQRLAETVDIHIDELMGVEDRSPTYSKYHVLLYIALTQFGDLEFKFQGKQLLQQWLSLARLGATPLGNIVTTAGRATFTSDPVINAVYRCFMGLKQPGNTKRWTLDSRPDAAVFLVAQKLKPTLGILGTFLLPKIHNETTYYRYDLGHVVETPEIDSPNCPQWGAIAFYGAKGEKPWERYLNEDGHTYNAPAKADKDALDKFLADPVRERMGKLLEVWKLGPHPAQRLR